ncbi:hypothetical protein E1A91_A09G042400v1, partial [Gossypium mustelinum]
ANADTYTNTKDANDPDQTDEVALIRYSQQSDFRRDIIKGSMHAQRRKTITWELFQANVHSPLFLDRGSVLITQSILRKYIILPSLIIVKNIARMLLFQFPEWSKELTDWNREMHVKCTYNGVQLLETEFPKNWLTEGIQIKILFPFCLKPWHRFKLQPSHKDPMKKRKDSIISNKMIHKSSLQIQSM